MKRLKGPRCTFRTSSHLKSQQRIVSWARKHKHKHHLASTNINVPLHCPLSGCLGLGHINGRDLNHITLSGCPFYHNLPFEKWAEMRAREDGLAPLTNLNNHQSTSPSKHIRTIFDRSNHFKTTLKEPQLDDLASPMEIYQFRRAQQRLVSNVEVEAKEHLLLCARVASQSEHESKNENVEYATEQRIHSVIFGNWELQPFYRSNYPPDVSCLPNLYVCEFCLVGMRHFVALQRHRITCGRTFPPGNEIYRKETLSFFEVDGQKDPEYCRNLCLLAKLFLKQKTVSDLDQVSEFLFYVLTETDPNGAHLVGYFSKQKAEDQCGSGSLNCVYNNLSCILILPHYQCRGFGRMLIELSYILSRFEQRIGSPERPLSDLGLIIYRKYWTSEILTYLANYTSKSVNIRTMSQDLGIAIPDIVSTLLDMKLLIYYRTQYYIINNKEDIDALRRTIKVPDPKRCIDLSCLHCAPHTNSSTTTSNKSPSQKSANTIGCSETTYTSV